MLSLVFGTTSSNELGKDFNYGRVTADDDEGHSLTRGLSEDAGSRTQGLQPQSGPQDRSKNDLICFDSPTGSFTAAASTPFSDPSVPRVAMQQPHHDPEDAWASFVAERHVQGPSTSTPGSSRSAHTTAIDDLFTGIPGTPGTPTSSVAAAINTPMPGVAEGGAQPRTASADLEGSEVPTERRELLIYAIPLYKDNFVFLPVTAWREEPEQQTGWVQKKVSTVASKVTEQFDSLGQADAGTLSHRVYKLGRRILDNMTPEERLMHNIPQHATKVIIYHPAQVLPDAIMEKLTTVTEQYGTAAVAKASVAGLLLPLAFGIDVIILPGPSVLTYYTAWEIYKNASGARGQQRLRSYVSQQGVDKVRVNYAGQPKLDKYADRVRDAPDGVLTEDDIEELCHEVNEPDLLGPLLALREQHIRKQPRRAADSGPGEYAVLPSSGGSGDASSRGR